MIPAALPSEEGQASFTPNQIIISVLDIPLALQGGMGVTGVPLTF